MSRRYSILVVDDEPSVLFTYRLLLEKQGYDVAGAVTCDEALRSIDARAFDLLLCDLSLDENHTGFEVLEYARAKNPVVPCILLTGYASADSAQKAQTMDLSVLYKPIDIDEFLSTIPNILRKAYEQTAAGGS